MPLSSKQDLTRGGQIVGQNVGMAVQVVNEVLYWSLISAVAGFVLTFLCRTIFLQNGTTLFWQWISTEINYYLDKLSLVVSPVNTTQSLNTLNLPYVVYFENTIKLGFVIAIIVGVITATVMVWSFKKYGKTLAKDKKIRGKSIVDAQKFATMLTKEEQSLFKISYATPIAKSRKYPAKLEQTFTMPKDFEIRHTFVHGANGTGKTQLLNQFFVQTLGKAFVQTLGQKGKKIVFDRNGHAAEVFYRKERGDMILNPFNQGTVHWDFFTEFRNYNDYKLLASLIIPEGIAGNDKVWMDAPRKVIVNSLMELQEKSDKRLPEFLYFLSFMSITQLHRELAESSSGRVISKENERMASSIQGIISTYVDAFETLLWIDAEKGVPKFSICDWLLDDKDQSCLFITYPEEQAETLKPLLSLFFSLVVHWYLSLSSDSKRRAFLFCDELAAFQRLDKLHSALTEGRKYGLSLFVATQNYFDIVKIYGQNEAKSILDQFNTKFFFRAKEIETSEFVSKSLGEQEVETVIQNRAYSSNQYRDGISAITHKEMRRMVLASEVSSMQDLECYMDSLSNPLVHLNLFYKPWAKRAIAFDKVDPNKNYQIMKEYVRSRRRVQIPESTEHGDSGITKAEWQEPQFEDRVSL